MAERSNEYKMDVLHLRKRLLWVLDPNDESLLIEFSEESYNWAKEHGELRQKTVKNEDGSSYIVHHRGWDPVENSSMGVFAGAFKALTTLLGGSGCSGWAQEAFEKVRQQWVESGRVEPNYSSRTSVVKEEVLVLPTVWQIAASFDGILQGAEEEDLLKAAKRIHASLKAQS